MVDDHAVVLRGLRAILEDEMPGVTVETAGTAREAYAILQDHRFAAVILDLGLPYGNGLELLKRIHQGWPHQPVLVLSMYSEEQYGLRVMKAGAAGFLTKATAPENLIHAVLRVINGGHYVSPELAELLASQLSGKVEVEPHQTLSDLEYQVFRMIASDNTVSEIAAELYLSVKTVSTHRIRILEKTGMKTNAEITHYAIANHLVD